MPITPRNEPAGGRDVVLSAIADRQYRDHISALIGAANIGVVLPVYVLDVEGITAPNPLNAANMTGWRYPLKAGRDSTLVTLTQDRGALRFAGIDYGPTAERLLEGAELAEKRLAGRPETFEPRLLDIPSLRLSALWLRASESLNYFVFILDAQQPGAVPYLEDGIDSRIAAALRRDDRAATEIPEIPAPSVTLHPPPSLARPTRGQETWRFTRRRGRSFANYFKANFWALLPAAGILLVITTAQAVNRLPADCNAARAGDKATSWFLCKRAPNPLERIFLPYKAAVITLPDKPPVVIAEKPESKWLPSPVIAAVAALPAGPKTRDAPDISKPAAPAQPGGASTGQAVPPTPSVAPAQPGPTGAEQPPLAAQPGASALPAGSANSGGGPTAQVPALPSTGRPASELSTAAQSAVATIAIAPREAKSRLLWISSVGILEMICIVVGVGALWFTLQSFAQYTHYLNQDGSPIRYMVQFGILSVVLSLIFLFFLYLLMMVLFDVPFLGVEAFANAGLRKAAVGDDQLMAWLTTYEPSVERQIHITVLSVIVGLALVAQLVTTTLYQSPNDERFRRSNDLTEPRNAQYLRYLGRSFFRLKLAIYMGAALLAATVAEVAARYAWPLSLLPPDMKDISTVLEPV